MDKLRTEFINAIMISLKISDNPFIVSTIDEYTSHLLASDYKKFMTSLFGTDHSYLNGLGRIAKVAESFKPEDNKDLEKTKEAERLMSLCYEINDKVFKESSRTGVPFSDLMKKVKFKNINPKDIAILNNVNPYCSHKLLITNISGYENGLTQLRAFISALDYKDSIMSIENSKVRKMIKDKR
jgi:hypothetical protein